jgi:hypothetical protein
MTVAELIYLAEWRDAQDKLVREENTLLRRLITAMEEMARIQRGKQ